MVFRETGLRGLIELTPEILSDNRGYFLEYFRQDELAKISPRPFVQDNFSFSKKDVLRGFHIQLPPYEQTKLVSVINGKVLDVVVDVRRNSATFGNHYKCVLDGIRKNMLLVPAGFAHGFLALEDSEFYYKCSAYYNREAEAGFCWNDPSLKIEWPEAEYILSEKDLALPDFETALKHW